MSFLGPVPDENLGHYVENDGLYYLSPTLKSLSVSYSATQVSSITWHQRLGHASSNVLAQIPTLDNANFNKNYKEFYSIYPLAKQTKFSFSLSTFKTSSLFEAHHSDLWGPYKILIFMVVTIFSLLLKIALEAHGLFFFLLSNMCSVFSPLCYKSI